MINCGGSAEVRNAINHKRERGCTSRLAEPLNHNIALVSVKKELRGWRTGQSLTLKGSSEKIPAGTMRSQEKTAC